MIKSFFTTAFILLAGFAYAQKSSKTLPKDWHLKDRSVDSFYGISLAKAYDLVKNKKSKPVIVAVIDAGIDTLHEDLKAVLWRNPDEVPGNGLDDDHNGYTDDVFGWNFLGGRDGRNVTKDSYEAARVYHQYKNRFLSISDPDSLSAKDKIQYTLWKKAAADKANSPGPKVDVDGLNTFSAQVFRSDSILCQAMGAVEYTGNQLEAFTPADEHSKKAKASFLGFMKANNAIASTNKHFLEGFNSWLAGELHKATQQDKAPEDFRGNIVGDNYADFNDRFYGNNDVMAGNPFHGTHVSGIIAAVRNNGVGMDGIAHQVRIMTLRAVPDGDEHDKDIALAIRYAVDNGARIINMSFGKGLSPEKHWVDDAVRYAESKNVLLVHAAGNEALNIDTSWNFPNPVYSSDYRKAANWISVGASGDPVLQSVVAPFSNYGKDEVDVFAPGMQIFSTVPGGNKYDHASGTSMAAPVVSGVAALILSYYPKLSAAQLKNIIESSAVKFTGAVTRPGSNIKLSLSALSRTGGIVNAYEALKVAKRIKRKNKLRW